MANRIKDIRGKAIVVPLLLVLAKVLLLPILIKIILGILGVGKVKAKNNAGIEEEYGEPCQQCIFIMQYIMQYILRCMSLSLSLSIYVVLCVVFLTYVLR